MLEQCMKLLVLFVLLLERSHAQSSCHSHCRCLSTGNECVAQTPADLQKLTNTSVYQLTIQIPPLQQNSIQWSRYDFLLKVRKLVVDYSEVGTLLLKLLPLMESLNHVTVKGSSNGDFPEGAYNGKNLVTVNVKTQNPKYSCNYRKIPTKGNCSEICGNQYYGERMIANETVCVCAMCTSPQSNTKGNKNSTNITQTVFVEHDQHKDTVKYSLILAGFSLLTLLTNFFVLSKICSCRGLTVMKIFGMSLMIFNVLLAEYGIAIAAYLSQEDCHWDNLFCSGLSSLKLFAINAAVFTLTLMIFHKSVNPVDGTLEKREVRFKAIVYILEGLMFSGMGAVMSWVKIERWDYLCSIWRPQTTVDQLLYGLEATPHIALILLWLKHLYRGGKRLRSTGYCEELVELELSPEREHPIFFMTLITSVVWSVPYILTAKFSGLVDVRASAVIRTCAYLFGAALHPFMFVLRDSLLCNFCCKSQISSAEDELLVCECKGMQMCKNCEQDMGRILARCEDHYIFEDRRKSMSLDNLSLSLPRKKTKIAHPNVKECRGVSNSFPLLSTPILEENHDEEEGPNSIRKSFSMLLSKFLHEKLPDSIISYGTPKKKKFSACGKLRDSYSSLPLLNNNSPKSTPQRKNSHRVCFRSVHNTPVKKPLIANSERSNDLVGREKEDETFENFTGGNTETEGLLEESSLQKEEGERRPSDRNCLVSPGDKKLKQNANVTREENEINCNKKAMQNARKSPGSAADDSQSPTLSDKSDPNRHSRIPTFIPFNSEPGPSGYFADKESDNLTPVSVASPPLSPPKEENGKKRKLNGGRKIFKKRGGNKKKENDKTRVSRGPTFFPLAIEEDAALDTSTKKKSKEDKMKRKKSKKERKDESANSKSQPCGTEQRTVSMDSLEWDPSFSLSDSSSSPVEELVSPVPPMKPSPFALKTIEQARQSSSSYGSAGRGSSYSMEWDPTSIQPRVMTPQCEWEPYSVEEPGSIGSSNGVAGALSNARNELERANLAAV